MEYPSEALTLAERERLAPHVTHLDGPVFGLVNLPEMVKGALFARYSRYPGTLRRLFLDEFADSLPQVSSYDDAEGERAGQLYERIFVGYGDDSMWTYPLNLLLTTRAASVPRANLRTSRTRSGSSGRLHKRRVDTRPAQALEPFCHA